METEEEEEERKRVKDRKRKGVNLAHFHDCRDQHCNSLSFNREQHF